MKIKLVQHVVAVGRYFRISKNNQPRPSVTNRHPVPTSQFVLIICLALLWNLSLGAVWVGADPGSPPDGTDAPVSGLDRAQGDRTIKEIPDGTFVRGQIVVRLHKGVQPEQFAQRYQLIWVQAILESGNIHLFATQTLQEDVVKLMRDVSKRDRDLIIWAEPNYLGGIPEANPYDTWEWGLPADIQGNPYDTWEWGSGGNPYDTWEWGGQDDNGYVNQFAFEQVNLPGGRSYLGDDVIVAVLDTGVSHSHPVLAPRLVPGWDMIDDDPLADDVMGGPGSGHGTHVAGIIAQIAPHSRIMPIRVLNTSGNGQSFIVAYAIEWAIRHGARVINLSLGTNYDSKVLRDTIEWATKKERVVVVAAAGNGNTNEPQFPAVYKNVIAVTGVDSENVKASFANYGKKWVDVAAPAVGIVSTMSTPAGSGYASWSGTSMATPFVSGAAALGVQQKPERKPSKVEKLIQKRAKDLNPYNPFYKNELGGLLDIGAFLGNRDVHQLDDQIDDDDDLEEGSLYTLPSGVVDGGGSDPGVISPPSAPSSTQELHPIYLPFVQN